MTKEEHLQIAVADYIRLQYPKALFCHIANERQTTPQRGGKLKRMGVRPGMPDVMVYHKREIEHDGQKGTFCGVAIELKVRPNKPSQNQLDTLVHLNRQGWLTAVCYSFDESRAILDRYLGA